MCVDGFNGSNCQADIDECESAPCFNNGRCDDRVNEFYCNCSNTGECRELFILVLFRGLERGILYF